jgi:outer membrane immunogenic protein
MGDFMIRNLGWAFAAAASLAGIGAASAADMAVKARPLPPPIYSWTGCYIGLSAGGKGVGIDERITTVAIAPFGTSFIDLGRREAETWIAGGQVGCNYQSGNWVFGIEGDAHAQRWSQSDILAGVLLAPFVNGSRFDLSSDWQASVRGRIGYAMNRTLFYGTAGAAFTEVRSSVSWIPVVPGPTLFFNNTRTLTGVTVGAGVEHAVTDNFTLGLEGRYSWYERERFNLGAVPVGVIAGAAVVIVNGNAYRDIKIETGEIMVKANWKFGPTAVVARY